MRATTAFNRMLAVPGASVASVATGSDDTVVTLRRRFQRATCPVCGWSTTRVHDERVRRWRHLDLAGDRLWLQMPVRRLRCVPCGRVVTEAVPWARPAARFTRDFEAAVAWLVQRCDRTTVSTFQRCSWEAVRDIVVRVVASHIHDSRLDDVRRIGVDDIAFRKGHRYLTVVADHDRAAAVIWADEGRNAATLGRFFAQLGPRRCAKLEAISLDMGIAYAKAARDAAPQARQCIDPFHVIALCNQAVNATRLAAWREERQRNPRPKLPPGRPRAQDRPGPDRALWIKHTRWALLIDPDRFTPDHHDTLDQLRRTRSALYRAWQIKEALRDLYRLDNPQHARAHLNAWLAWACRCRIPAIVKLSRTIRTHSDGIIAAVELGLSNSKLEGLNSKIRLINHRGYGHHSAPALIALLYLCAGGITIQLPQNITKT